MVLMAGVGKSPMFCLILDKEGYIVEKSHGCPEPVFNSVRPICLASEIESVHRLVLSAEPWPSHILLKSVSNAMGSSTLSARIVYQS
jgi:hypothetical protein